MRLALGTDLLRAVGYWKSTIHIQNASKEGNNHMRTRTRISNRNKYLARGDEITKEENENIHLKSLSSNRAGFPNWLLSRSLLFSRPSWGYFAHFIIMRLSSPRETNFLLMPLTKSQNNKNTIILLHSPRRLLQPQLCASLHFKQVSCFVFPSFLCVALLFLCSLLCYFFIFFWL